MKKTWVKALFTGTLFFAVERFCHKQTHGFRPYKFHSDLTYNPAWDIPPLSLEEERRVEEILSQPFYFLGSGGESYAFISKDRHFVLKVFKHHHMRTTSWVDQIPLPRWIEPLQERYKEKRIDRQNTLFTSCLLAYNRLKQQTGLVYLHLNKTSHLNKTLSLFDPIGILHLVDLDKIEFALQEAATSAYPTLAYLVETQEIEGAKVRLKSLLDLTISRCKAGVADHDARKRNFGFVGEKAIELDLGSFSLNEDLKIPQNTNRIFLYETIKLRTWVKKYHPELTDFLEEKVREYLHSNS